jgi:hypothetical protein
LILDRPDDHSCACKFTYMFHIEINRAGRCGMNDWGHADMIHHIVQG